MIEKFNSTLIGMVSKVAASSGRYWDTHLPFPLFAATHDSTRESPFYLLYGRDPRIPSESVLSQPVSLYLVDVDDYHHDLRLRCSVCSLIIHELQVSSVSSTTLIFM